MPIIYNTGMTNNNTRKGNEMNSYKISGSNDTFIHTHRDCGTSVNSWNRYLGIYVNATMSRNQTVQLFHRLRRDGIKLQRLADIVK